MGFRVPLLLAAIVIIAGCATPAAVVVTTPPPVLGTGSAIVLKVQNMVRTRCRFAVSADSVGAILGVTYLPDDVADAICLAVLQRQGDPATPRVNGVGIIGRFVR